MHTVKMRSVPACYTSGRGAPIFVWPRPLHYNSSTANGPSGPEVEPPSVFRGHNCIETLKVPIIARSPPEIYQNCSYELSGLPLTTAHLGSLV